MCFAIKCRNISVVQVRSCNRDLLLLLVLCVDELTNKTHFVKVLSSQTTGGAPATLVRVAAVFGVVEVALDV